MTKEISLLILFLEIVQPHMDEIGYHWDRAFESLLPAAFRHLRLRSEEAIYDLIDQAGQRMQRNMTDSARQKLRVQMKA